MGWRMSWAMGNRMKCSECLWKYPDAFLNRMNVNGNYTDPICGICALEIANRMTGIKRGFFQGETAETARRAAIKWRKNHPADGPKVN